MLKAVIVDDEEDAIFNLRWYLNKYCPQVELVGTFNKVDPAIRQINELRPDLLFLDVEMPVKNGFQVLEEMEFNCGVIFTTAHEKYAFRAFKFDVIDYLLKPINSDELVTAVKKAVEKRTASPGAGVNIPELVQYLRNEATSRKIPVASMTDITLVDIDRISHCIADKNYTEIYLFSGEKLVASKSLKEYEELLAGHNFFRIHKSVIINLAHVRKILREDGGIVMMTDGSRLEISKRKRAEFFAMYK